MGLDLCMFIRPSVLPACRFVRPAVLPIDWPSRALTPAPLIVHGLCYPRGHVACAGVGPCRITHKHIIPELPTFTCTGVSPPLGRVVGVAVVAGSGSPWIPSRARLQLRWMECGWSSSSSGPQLQEHAQRAPAAGLWQRRQYSSPCAAQQRQHLPCMASIAHHHPYCWDPCPRPPLPLVEPLTLPLYPVRSSQDNEAFLSSSCPAGKVPFITPEAMNQVHIW